MVNSGNTPTPNLDERPQPSLNKDDPKIISDRYTILDRLGQGGMGKVYRAVDPVLNRLVAIKVLPFRYHRNEDLQRFQQEARAASKLNHPGIVKAWDFGLTEKQEPYLIMEYVDGETLDKVLRKGRLEQLEFIDLFLQVSDAMHHAHKNNVVHRDLKPSNIILRRDDHRLETLVLDFGIAKIFQDTNVEFHTGTGLILGSPTYISPEQVSGARLDGRSDIYSLGCIMFESLTGSPPFRDETTMEIFRMHQHDSPPSLKSACPNQVFPEEIETLIARCLAKSPDRRFQSMLELHDALMRMSSPATIQSAPEDRILPKRALMKHLLFPSIAILSALLFLAVFGALTASPPIESGQNETVANATKNSPEPASLSDAPEGAATYGKTRADSPESLGDIRDIDKFQRNQNDIDEKNAAEYEARGDYARAEPLRWRVFESRNKETGTPLPAILSSMVLLATNLHGQKKYREAEVFMVKCEKLCEKSRPEPEAPRVVATVFLAHAGNLLKLGRIEQSEVRCKRALQLMRSIKASRRLTANEKNNINELEKGAERFLLVISKSSRDKKISH